jgi:hypothetical protein
MTELEIDLILTNTFMHDSRYEISSSGRKIGERTTKFATEINKEVASASEENCA